MATPQNKTQLLKYLRPGMTLMRQHHGLPSGLPADPEPKPVTVMRVQSNAFTVEIERPRDGKVIESWHRLASAREYVFHDGGFTWIDPYNDNRPVVTYEFPEAVA